jgi:rod shape-determining protein MreC
MAFGVANSSLPGRGPTPGLRFVAYSVLAIVLMFLDKRQGWMEEVRYGLQAATYPMQLAVSSPSTAWGWMRESARTRDALRVENTELRTRMRDLELRTMRYDSLARENAKLRGLSAALPPVAEKWLVAEIVHAELDSLRPRVLINRGANNGVFKAQAVLDDEGIVGQTTHVGPWSAEVILITDPEHAIPVQIERTGVRTIAVGTGNEGELGLPYLPGNADVQAGDMLVTSGLGGVFPQGYPVGKVLEVHREVVQPLAQVRAAPLAHINRDREVMLVWFRETHPAAPVRGDGLSDLLRGDPSVKPQMVPLKPGATGAASGPSTTTGAGARGGASAPTTGTSRPATTGAGPRGTVPVPAPTRSPANGAAPANQARPGNGAPTAPPSAPGTNAATPANQPATTPPSDNQRAQGNRQ